MQVVKLWYYPRVLVNKDPLESDGSSEYDYKQLVKSEIYFSEDKSPDFIERAVLDINNSGVIALDSFRIEDEGGES